MSVSGVSYNVIDGCARKKIEKLAQKLNADVNLLREQTEFETRSLERNLHNLRKEFDNQQKLNAFTNCVIIATCGLLVLDFFLKK